MKKIVIAFTIILLLTGCMKSDAVKFKEDYESLNGETNSNKKEYRVIEIDADNPFVYANLKTINKKINKKETFIVYFGANWCPWCRSVLPTAIDEAKKAGVEKIYYIDVRPDNDIEKDIRDIYETNEKGEIYLSHEGTDAYHEFIKTADQVLNLYTAGGIDLTGTQYEGAKRVGAPSFILVKDGVVTRRETGVSEQEEDPYMQLNDQIISDMQMIFRSLYNDYLN